MHLLSTILFTSVTKMSASYLGKLKARNLILHIMNDLHISTERPHKCSPASVEKFIKC